ncbi:DpnII family type II restriction endonuclease [Metasolibacillus fluoroglycofenilyticus]|uniref:DpnII family type II restriction endonuclease n=1 Tax=Metasolibacillus fluoroglycofenilyticus TaxID=1239396 RepID=UPI00137B2ED1|nr:DpnII family type II restriction endonuclease [Metasolibacillus fluoroglycofenilyticus]
MATPFVKWAGGKSKLASFIIERIEKSIGFENITHYVEAFTGGGALFLKLVSQYNFKTITLIDINVELINAYKAIKTEPYTLMGLMDNLQTTYNDLETEEDKSAFYYEVRELFNTIENKDILKDNISYERAAQFIFLNKTCFNGLYRENSKGKYNVPFGKRKEVNLYEQTNILSIHLLLQNVNLICGDYKLAKKNLQPGTLIYFDPPYRPITGTASFTAYSKDGFNDSNQIELAQFCKEIDKAGVYFALSNSDPYNKKMAFTELDDFFDNLYSNFEIHRINASRAIAAKGTSRNSVTEVLILNSPSYNEIEGAGEVDLTPINHLGDIELHTFETYQKLSKDEKFMVLMDTLSLTNRTPEYYVKWDKVESNTRSLEISLNTMNYLIGKENIFEEALELFQQQPQLIKAIPTLLAIRDEKFEVLRINENAELLFENLDFKHIDEQNITKYVEFAEESGLLKFLAQKATKSLVDYVFGVEVGLDSNGRKNRSGSFMEQIVEEKVAVVCGLQKLEYLAQASAAKIKLKWDIDVPYKESMRNHDFAIFNPKTKKLTIMEVNYYGGGGSKLKSVAGEFAELSAYFEIQSPDIQFVWITDGQGWHTANRPLRDAFEVIDYIINLKMMNANYLEEILSL